MGLFSSIFGKAKVDTASYQKAIDAFNSIATPELSALQVQLDKYVQAGKLSPEAAESVLLNSNSFNDIKLDPALQGAQKQALQQLQNIATQGGLTATDKAQLNDITQEQNTTARGRNEAILSNARERGIGGSGLELTSQLLNEQEAANRASERGTQVAANAEQRALASLQAAGQMGGQMEAQQYGEAANKAQAQNAIDKFNAETQQNTNLLNVQNRNAAEAANLAATQDISNKNTATQQTEAAQNAAAVQQDYANKMGKAQNVANVYQNMAGANTQANQQEKAADVGLASGLLGAATTAGGYMMAGPAGGVAASKTNPYGWKPGMSSFEGGYSQGGKVPGTPEVDGDSPKNDKVPAMLSPGEIVVPRSAAQDEEDFAKFMREAKSRPMNCGGKVHMAQGGEVPAEIPMEAPMAPPEAPQALSNEDMVAKALKSLQYRVTNLEGGK
jgi:hypothetical protein